MTDDEILRMAQEALVNIILASLAKKFVLEEIDNDSN